MDSVKPESTSTRNGDNASQSLILNPVQSLPNGHSDASPQPGIPGGRSTLRSLALNPQSSAYIIDVKGLCKAFNHKPAVCNVDLQIKQGEIYGFLGPNGSGKTTTIRMICGLLKPDAGQGFCLGYDILTQSAEIKRHVGYMTQRFSLYDDLNVRENLMFIARMYELDHPKTRVNEALDRLRFDQDQAKKLAGHLSGGWKQRLALAGALLHSPQVLLLDEPTAGVDPQARRDFWVEIHRLSNEGITTLVSTHYMDEAERCTQLAYIAYGHILTRGTVEAVIDQAGLYVWIASGDHLTELAHQLRDKDSTLQITPFGNTLHMIGRDKIALANALQPFKNQYHLTEGKPNLEDVFIHLVSQAKEKIT